MTPLITSLKPNYLPKAPPLYTIALRGVGVGLDFNIGNFRGTQTFSPYQNPKGFQWWRLEGLGWNPGLQVRNAWEALKVTDAWAWL